MSNRNANEYRQNTTNRRGIVVDREPDKMRVKVQFEDEDEVVTQWIDVLGGSSTGVSYFSMPGQGDEVWCAMDAKGEAGCLLGSRYNEKDPPPYDQNGILGIRFGGGHVALDTASGDLSIETGGTVRIKAGRIVLDGEVDLGGEGGELLHRKGDVDIAGHVAVTSASRVRAV